ncbi:MAG: type II secretion system GspH family protein [Planctomycetes bacterium]|nr:type II secretion system GspH family protein [Planctomycetota bacterium]
MNRQGFTLVELMIVLAIVAILLGLGSLVALTALEMSKDSDTQGRIAQIEQALEAYKLPFSEYPPSALDDIGGDRFAPNEENEGIEALVICLTSQQYSPYWSPDPGWLINTDGDSVRDNPTDSYINSGELFEVSDAWGNPIVYIHNSDYDYDFVYITSEDQEREVSAASDEKTGSFPNRRTFQIWSFGGDAENDGGAVDDIKNWTTD